MIDWGVRNAGTKNKNAQSLKEIERLIEHYEPDVIVLENPRGKGSRRYPRIEQLIRETARLALSRNVEVCRYSRESVREAFARRGARTKQQLAAAVAFHFPELAPRLPPIRKCWMQEGYSSLMRYRSH